MANEYTLDSGKLLVLDADYNQQIFIAVGKDSSGRLKPQLEYRGKNQRVGENIKKNILSLISLKPAKNGGVELFLGKEKFAGFCQENGRYVVDEKVPQEHLTAFEMRLLARPEQQKGVPFARGISKDKAPITDLHNHFAGAPSPEGLIEVGLKHNIDVPAWIVKKLGIQKDGLVKSESGYTLASVCQNEASKAKLMEAMQIPKEAQETFNKMEEIYAIRGMFTKNQELLPDLLMLIGKELSENGVKYTELSLSSVIGDMKVLETISKELPKVEEKTGCRLRFLAALWRHSDKEWNQDEVDRIKSVAKNPYVVGIDVMGHETNSTQVFGSEIKELTTWAMGHDPDFCIRVHAGENPLFKDNVKDVLKIMSQARQEYADNKGVDVESIRLPQVRIGHGLYGVDDETLDLCQKTGAVIEFNMSSNLSLNNIDSIRDVPLTEYIKRGIPFVLGTDGQGIYSTAATQEMLLASAAGVTAADFDNMRRTEEDIIAREERNFQRKKQEMQMALSEKTFAEIYQPTYATVDGKPRYNDAVALKHQQEKEGLMQFLHTELSRCQIETAPEKVEAAMSGKIPVLITGASVKAWPNISPKDQAEIRRTMDILVHVLDPKKAYILTGGTNHGVEKELHIAAHRRNREKGDMLAVIGTLTEDAAHTDRASIEADTITHATILSMENGRPAKSWFDLPDTVLAHVKAKNGEMVAIGGGGVVRDMIQRAHNMSMNISLMDGPAGASTDKAKAMPAYKFATAEELIATLYTRQPNVFLPGFTPQKIEQYLPEKDVRTQRGGKGYISILTAKTDWQTGSKSIKKTIHKSTPINPNGNGGR